MVTETEDLDLADWIFVTQDRWDKPITQFMTLTPAQLAKVVRVDFSDGGDRVPDYAARTTGVLFKKSVVRKVDGVFEGWGDCLGEKSPRCFPLVLAGRDNNYVGVDKVLGIVGSLDRPIDVGCYLRPWYEEGNAGRVPAEKAAQRRHAIVNRVGLSRNRVLDWVRRWAPPSRVVLNGPATTDNYQDMVLHVARSAHYRAMLRALGVAVLADPAEYAGAWRFFEHFAVGSVVVTEDPVVPFPFPFIPGTHYFGYDIREGHGDDFAALLSWLFAHPREAAAVAREGFLHAARYHRAVNRADYFLTTLATLRNRSSGYRYTGFDLRAAAQARTPTAAEKNYTRWARSMVGVRRPYVIRRYLGLADIGKRLRRRGGFAARTSSAVRPHARGVVSASGAPDVPADAYLVTYCHN